MIIGEAMVRSCGIGSEGVWREGMKSWLGLGVR